MQTANNEVENPILNTTSDSSDLTKTKRRNPRRTIDSKLGRTAELLAGIAAHTEPLTRRGIDTTFVTKFNTCYQAAIDIHNAQLAYKARMMEKTAELQATLDQLHAYYAEARNQVKITLPKATWREFGILDQRL